MLVTIALIIASYFDFKYRKIPNYISLLIIIASIYNGEFNISGLLVSGIILAVTLIPTFENYKGGGDIKILGAIGILRGFFYTYNLFLLSELLEIIYRYIILKPLKKEYKKPLPYAPFMLVANLILN